MKSVGIVLFFLNVVARGNMLEVPEGCFSKKNAPCLTQINANEETLSINEIAFRVTADSILQWKNFNKVSLDLLKGEIQVSENLTTFKLNEIPILNKNQMMQRQDNVILRLDLQSFILSTYDLSRERANSVLLKSSFLEKADFLKFTSNFFARKSAFVSFLNSVQTPWKAQLLNQSENQTKVLKRAVASAEESKATEIQEKLLISAELKKVREQFFYRTFYR